METLTNATPQAPPSDPPAQAPPKFYALFPSKGLGGVGGVGGNARHHMDQIH